MSSTRGHSGQATASAQSSRKRHNRFFRMLLMAAAFLFSLLIVEGALRALEKIQLGDRAPEGELVADPVLGQKLRPFAAGHDGNGFRNDSIPEHADVVVLGDSQTWGVNARREAAWPQQLAKLSQRSVYNMALGGFGPVQYHALLPQALRFTPKIVVVGLYLGNDIYDAYHMAYQYEAHQKLRSSGAGDLHVDTVGERANAFWNAEKAFHESFGRASFFDLSFWLREHLAIGRLLNRAHLWPGSQDVDHEIDKRWATAQPERGAISTLPERETIFTTAYRLEALNLNESRIAEGLRISRELLVQMKQETEAAGARFLVVLLPTKESVYALTKSGTHDLHPTYRKLVEMEGRIRSEILSTCNEQKIEAVDAFPVLADALDRGQPIYPTTTEGHPNPLGYSVIASMVQEKLGKLN